MADSLHIVHYLPAIRLEHGGVVRMVLDECAALSQRGHRMTLLTYDGPDIPVDWLQSGDGVNPRAILVSRPTLPGEPLSRASLRIADAALAGADILHLHAPWLAGNRQLARFARRRSIPYLVTLHGMLDDWAMQRSPFKKRLYMRLLGRHFLRRAAAVRCTAEAERTQSAKWFSNPNTLVLPPLLDLTPFFAAPAASYPVAPQHQGKRIILFLSRLHEQKGVDIFLRAIAQLRDDPPWAAMIAGTGSADYESSMRQVATDLHLQEKVSFLGLVTGEAKIALYHAADLFVLPTRHENFGIVLAEAMAAGLAVITTRGADIWPEVSAAGGVIVELSPPAVAEGIGALLSDPQRLGECGDRARQWTMANWSLLSLTAQHESLYHRLKAMGWKPTR